MRVSADYYTANFGELPIAIAGFLQALLDRSARLVEGECRARGIDLEERIDNDEIDEKLVKDIVCQMVQEAASSVEYVGVSQHTQTGGPYSESFSYRDTAGRLYLGKDARRLLGLSKQRSFTVNTAPSRWARKPDYLGFL